MRFRNEKSRKDKTECARVITCLKETFEVFTLKGLRRRAAFGGSSGVPSYTVLINLNYETKYVELQRKNVLKTA